MRFESPIAFWLLLLIPLLLWRAVRQRSQGSLRVSTVQTARLAGQSLRQVFLPLPLALRLAALGLLVVALARPQKGLERVHDRHRGIAIEMVIDRSGSMSAEMEYEGQRLTRLEVVKRVFADFVHGDGRTWRGRPSDLIGLTAFARYADTLCPPTLSHDTLTRFLDTIEVPRRREEDGTAIGDAIALAAARLKSVEEAMARHNPHLSDGYTIESKVIILLTDGEENAGRRTMHEAAALAAAWGIRIYAIGVASGTAGMVRTPLGAFRLPLRDDIDEAALSRMAESTGGMFRLATDAKSLQAITREIDRLTTSAIEAVRSIDYRERFTPFALAALALLALDTLLRCTVFRRAP